MPRTLPNALPRTLARAIPVLMSAALCCALGCGVAGRPMPPGPTPAAAPRVRAVSTPDGLELSLSAPLRDLDGAPIDGAELWVYAAESAEDCAGPPLMHGAAGAPLLLPPDIEGPVRVVAVRQGRVGEPSPALDARWTAPPPPPEAPLVFVDGAGQVQISWLPPEAPIEEVELQRDGRPLATVEAGVALWTDRPGPGRHRYTVVGLGDGLRTAPSAAAVVEVGPQP